MDRLELTQEAALNAPGAPPSADNRAKDGDIAISIRGLRNSFGEQIVHDGLDLDVRKGEILGVVGGSGTGKSVLLNAIAVQWLRYPEAQVFFFDKGASSRASRSSMAARARAMSDR